MSAQAPTKGPRASYAARQWNALRDSRGAHEQREQHTSSTHHLPFFTLAWPFGRCGRSAPRRNVLHPTELEFCFFFVNVTFLVFLWTLK